MSLSADIADTKDGTPKPVVAPTHDTAVAAAEPVVDPASESPEDDRLKWLPQPMKNWVQRVSNWTDRMRTASITAAPTFVVNNSSNVLGASHVATEMLMFKSGLKGNNLIDDPSNPINWVVQPVQKIWKDVYTNSKSRDFTPMQLLRGNPIKNFQKYVMDTHDASHREVERQIAANRELVAAGKAAKKLSLGNPWQTRTTLTGLVIWSLSTVIPERKESDEEIERMAKLRTLHPVQYIGERLKQAVWLPDWNAHKREMLGLGYLAIGTFSLFGSWRNRGELKSVIQKDAELISKGLTQGYKFNAAYFGTAVVSFLAGLPMLFALDERRAYSTYGALSLLRIPLLPASIGSKIRDKEAGWQYYLAGKATFQLEDMAFSAIGGATKIVKPDGSIEIVDHEKLKKDAIHKAKVEKIHRKGDVVQAHRNGHLQVVDNSVPSTMVAQASQPELAMPERVAKLEKKGEAANDSSMIIAANGR